MSTPDRFDTADLRRALGCFGTGVTVVSTLNSSGEPVGVTANSFSSVSLDPPIVLWSLRRASPSLAAFDASSRFVVHVLTVQQVELSRRFASPVSNRFAGITHHPGLGGLPLLEGCSAVFQCLTEQRLEVGDHILFLGRVQAYDHRPGPTLLYCQGQYTQGLDLEPR
jgi:3-hydroxy-9,10-secoandrosta-1,3,5(10)-triene-9,17-dione monooxygenase reductase component